MRMLRRPSACNNVKKIVKDRDFGVLHVRLNIPVRGSRGCQGCDPQELGLYPLAEVELPSLKGLLKACSVSCMYDLAI